MRNLRLTLAYDGTDFHGWQRQPDRPTIQECLESGLEKIIGERVVVHGSGRTDAGVHAANQVANFKTRCAVPCKNLVKALNDHLPAAVRVKDACEVPETFQARDDVRSRTYRYRILKAPICSPFVGPYVWHYPYPLDHKRMAEAAGLIEGEHDFTSFAGSGGEGPVRDATGVDRPRLRVSDKDRRSAPARNPQFRSMIRTIFCSRILWRGRSQMLVYEVSSTGFLHHMVRNIVGTLVEVGRGKLAPQDMATILAARDRQQAGPTAPAQGLCLVKVEYQA